MTSILTPADPRWAEFTTMLSNAVEDRGCQHDHRLAELIMAHEWDDIDIPGSLEFFRQHGGYCDCKILFNVEEHVRENQKAN